MKPTPSKLVLLMSAAGLGLSWSGVALASRDSHAPASFALTFGVAPRSEPGCDAQVPEAWASCAPAQGELVRSIVAEAAALPLPLLAMVPAGDVRPPWRARATDGEPQPNDEVPRPETPATVRVADGSSRDREADSIAMVLLDDLRAIADDAPTDSKAIAYAPSSALPRLSVSIVAGDSSPDVRKRVGKAASRGAIATTADAGKAGAAFADARSTGGAQAAASEHVPVADSASVERVLASLAEVLGSHLDEPSSGIGAGHEQASAPKHEAELRVSAAPAAPQPAQVVMAPPVEATHGERSPLQRSSEADEIVVAPSHSDKILMSLAALRSGEGSGMGSFGAQTKNTVVVGHTDKVLETLALFQSRKPKRMALACTAAPDEEARVAMQPAETRETRAFAEPTDESPLAAIGHEPDILLDGLPLVSELLDEPALLAAPAQPKLPELPVASRSRPSAIGSELVALSADKLDEVRGGFVTDGGLKISFGIERAVYLNGNLVTTTSLNIADLSKISGGQAQVTGSGTAGSLALLQSGVGNVFAPGSISSTVAGTVIQNTLDNQKINTITRIDAVVNSAGIMRSMNLQSSMQSAIVNSLRR